MLSFIPMNNFATIYKQSSKLDDWGQPLWNKSYANKCQILYNQDLEAVSDVDGHQTIMATTLVFNGLVDVRVGDKVGYKDALGVEYLNMVEDVYFGPDYGGKIIFTRVVSGKGKRY